MITERYRFPKCGLKMGQHKGIDVDVHLEISVRSEDNDKPEDFHEGVRAIGELSFDCYPIGGWKDHPVQKNKVGDLCLCEEGNQNSTRVNILFVDKNGERTILKDRIRRYIWLFYVIGKPLSDGLEIFPWWYTGKLMNKLFTCTDFRGIWPIGVSSVVVAKDQPEAKRLLIAALKQSGINQPEIHDLTLQEIDLKRPHVAILNTGEY
jgi:hypothetical protein